MRAVASVTSRDDNIDGRCRHLEMMSCFAARVAAGFHHRQTLRHEPVVNFGAILEHPRLRHSVTTCPENSKPLALGADSFFVSMQWSQGTRTRAVPGQRNEYWAAPWGLR